MFGLLWLLDCQVSFFRSDAISKFQAGRSERSRGASMGSDSLLQGDFSTTLGATRPSTFQGALEMTGRDLGILRSRIQPVE